ncbi:MAG: MmgE/PrpD family protein [Thermodesulfobacteriota bacterium]|nr:MmgE/PrpD family protein [Thermodesulfobacteriota bacterium]
MTDHKGKKDVVWILANHLVNRNYEDLNPETIEVTKKCLLDTIGVIVAASGIIPECRLLVDLIKEGGGKEESTILGFGGRVPAWMAAFANGAMGHCLDYDDLQYEVPVHPSSPVVSASLAIAERLGNVSGKELITAIALGNDLICRMGLSIHWKMDWNVTTVLGAFGAAAAAGKLLKLNETAMVSALGIALSEAAGTQEMRYSMGNHMGGLRDGYPARGGALSALMAKQGILGPENCLEGRAGLFNLYFDGVYNREVLVADLGKRFEGINVGIKAWPTCGTSHVYIDATLRIVTDHDLHPQEIESITLYVGDFAMLHCQPLEERRRPPTTADAKYSIPFSSAVAATKRRVLIGDLTPEGIKDPAVLHMAQKVSPKLDTRFNAKKGEPPGMVEITTKEGKCFSQRLDVGYGHPHNPISKEDVINKFWDCISYSARPLSKEAAEKVFETVIDLERVQDIGSFIRLLS